ncbi:MAG: (d)CMP kinase [Candidatus Rokubacteria bacterium]|nr:(d)CMP kinase [Candidatus Rokubacteria bacterium]MBI2554725.1 (d)CMP kinase [Candidatus Rokubacteria bacterium]
MKERREAVITIDGPAGAGKSTAARELARRLGYRLIDTGALYRGLAWRVREAKVDPGDEAALERLLAEITIDLQDGAVLVNGRDVTGELRTPEIGELTSRISTLAAVREKVTPIQRRLAATGGAVLEGRDTGSVVCPDAEVKFYLDASPEVRAVRRRRELEARGTHVEAEEVRAEIRRRDRQDMKRGLAPLVVPEGAVVIDSTGRSVEQIVQVMLEEVARHGCCTRS